MRPRWRISYSPSPAAEEEESLIVSPEEEESLIVSPELEEAAECPITPIRGHPQQAALPYCLLHPERAVTAALNLNPGFKL